MQTLASIGKHPIHPMLVVFPTGLWIFSLVCDLIGLIVAMPDVWHTVAFYSMVGGLIGALAAAAPGLIDLLYDKGVAPPVKNIALTHMAINLAVVVLYAANIWLRIDSKDSVNFPIVLSAIGVCAIAVSGGLGGQMAHVYGAGVEGRELPHHAGERMYAIRNNEGACWHGQLDDQPARGSIEKAKRYPRRYAESGRSRHRRSNARPFVPSDISGVSSETSASTVWFRDPDICSSVRHRGRSGHEIRK